MSEVDHEVDYDKLIKKLKEGTGEDIIWIGFLIRQISYDEVPVSRVQELLDAANECCQNYFQEQKTNFKNEYTPTLEEIYVFYYRFKSYADKAGIL